MKNLILIAALFATAGVTASTALADCGNRSCCVCGKKVCVLEVSRDEEEVTCFDVEAKDICIPGIKLPWECKRRCGGVRSVCVLKEIKKEKTVCKYDWSLKTICTTCCKRHGFKHGRHHAQVQRDERVPFEYYTADLSDEENVAVAAAPQAVAATAAPATSAEVSAEEQSSRKPSSMVRAASAFLTKPFRKEE